MGMSNQYWIGAGGNGYVRSVYGLAEVEVEVVMGEAV